MKLESKDAKKIFDVISELMDIIERDSPNHYYKDNEILAANDLLKELEDSF